MLPWLTTKEMIAVRLREPSLADIAGKLDMPYFLEADLDDIMLECAQEILREVPEELLHAVGAAAQTVLVSSSGSVTIPPGVIVITGVSIDGAPAKKMNSVAMYYRKKRATATEAIYVYTSDFSGTGKLVYTGGTNLRATAILEPDLSVFQADNITLPPPYGGELVDRVLDRITIISS